MSQPDASPALTALKEWWSEMGVDVDEADIRAVLKGSGPAKAPPEQGQKRVKPRPIRKQKTHDDWVDEARQLALAAGSMAELRAAIEGFEGCMLKEAARNAACFDGVEGAPVMVIGEGPGVEEDRQAKPFVGKAGQLLDRMLGAIGLSRATNVFITNVNYWRPPGNRTPSDEELELCRPFVDRMIDLGRPKLIIAAGGVSSKSLLQASIGITKLRGTEQTLTTPGGYSGPLFPIFHPAFLLRRPEEKSRAWRDLLQIQEKLEGLN
jgi:DNA polymerase